MRPWATVTPKLDILQSKTKKLDVDDVLGLSGDKTDEKNDYSKEVIAGLPFASKLHRDLYMDEVNPREELNKFTESEDVIKPFDMSPLTLIAEGDELAKQQISLIQRGIRSWTAEENKYNPTAQSMTSDEGSEDAPIISGAKWNSILQKNLLMQYQTALDQSSCL